MTYETEYGYITIGDINRRNLTRLDHYVPKRDPHEQGSSVILCLDSQDLSLQYAGSYDRRCASCWLGFGHTERKHSASIKQEQEQGR